MDLKKLFFYLYEKQEGILIFICDKTEFTMFVLTATCN